MSETAFKKACSYYFRYYDRKPRDGVLSLSEFRNVYLTVLPYSDLKNASKWSQI
jgi:hypothetical protein